VEVSYVGFRWDAGYHGSNSRGLVSCVSRAHGSSEPFVPVSKVKIQSIMFDRIRSMSPSISRSSPRSLHQASTGALPHGVNSDTSSRPFIQRYWHKSGARMPQARSAAATMSGFTPGGMRLSTTVIDTTCVGFRRASRRRFAVAVLVGNPGVWRLGAGRRLASSSGLIRRYLDLPLQ